MAWVRTWLCKLQKGVLDSQPQKMKFTSYLPMVWWFSPGTPASSTTKTGHHDIGEILLKVALNTKNPKINHCLLNQHFWDFIISSHFKWLNFNIRPYVKMNKTVFIKN
jgi:hypothetical protein